MIPSWSLLYTIKAGEEKEKLTFNWEHRKPLFPSCATIKAMFLKKNLLKSKPSGRHQMSSFYPIICVIFLVATLGYLAWFLSYKMMKHFQIMYPEFDYWMVFCIYVLIIVRIQSEPIQQMTVCQRVPKSDFQSEFTKDQFNSK